MLPEYGRYYDILPDSELSVILSSTGMRATQAMSLVFEGKLPAFALPAELRRVVANQTGGCPRMPKLKNYPQYMVVCE